MQCSLFPLHVQWLLICLLFQIFQPQHLALPACHWIPPVGGYMCFLHWLCIEPSQLTSLETAKNTLKMLKLKPEDSSSNPSSASGCVTLSQALTFFNHNFLEIIILVWPKCSFTFFHKIKDTYFIFTNNFIDLDILSMSAVSRVVCWSQLIPRFDHYQLQLIYLIVEHHPVRNLQHETSQTTFDSFIQLQHLLHTQHKSFLCVSVVFLPFLK